MNTDFYVIVNKIGEKINILRPIAAFDVKGAPRIDFFDPPDGAFIITLQNIQPAVIQYRFV